MKIINLTISHKYQDVIIGRVLLTFSIEYSKIDHFRELGGPMEPILVQILNIKLNNLLNPTNNNRIEIIAIQGKALPNRSIIGRQLRTKPIQGYLIIIIEILEDANDLANALNIGIGIVVYMMIIGGGVQIGVGKINAYITKSIPSIRCKVAPLTM